jgi:hypothetical protein
MALRTRFNATILIGKTRKQFSDFAKSYNFLRTLSKSIIVQLTQLTIFSKNPLKIRNNMLNNGKNQR